MKCHQSILFLLSGIVLMLLSACATVDSITQTMGPPETCKGSETFYVGLDGLKLFPEPRFSKGFISTLPLNEKVVRDKLEKGFAHIRVVSTGQTGWVNNAHLAWRKSVSTKPIPQESAAPPKTVSQDPPPEKGPSEQNVIQAPLNPNPEIEGRDAAIFDRF